MSKRGVTIYKQAHQDEMLVLNNMYYSTDAYWTMSAFNVETPSVKTQSVDLPLADGAAEFVGFGDNIYYNARALTISLESSEGDVKFRDGEIEHFRKLIGQNVFVKCNWTESIQFNHYAPEIFAFEFGTADVENMTWTGKLISVAEDFKDTAHCGIRLTFSCNPYKTCDVTMNYLKDVPYFFALGIGWQLPNFSNNTTARTISAINLLSIDVTDEDDVTTTLTGLSALNKLKLYKYERGTYILTATSEGLIVSFNSPAKILYEGVTML